MKFSNTNSPLRSYGDRKHYIRTKKGVGHIKMFLVRISDA